MQLQSDLLQAWAKLINLSTIDELKDWIKAQGGGEGPQLELKQQRRGDGKKEDPLPKAVCALANSDGGIIIVGVIDPSRWEHGVINPQKEERQSIRDEIRDAFVHRRPEVDVVFNEALEITTILVKGNNPEPLLIKTPEKLIGGYRRKGDSSDPFRPEEVVAYCSGWKHQFDEILRRYDTLPLELDFKSTHNVAVGISRFFVNALPIQILTKRTFVEGNLTVPRTSTPIPRTFSVQKSVTTGSHTSIKARAGWDENKTVSVSAIGSGSYVVQVDVGRNLSDFHLNARGCIVGLYTAFALSYLREAATSWSIQGFYSINPTTLVVSHDPILYQAPQRASAVDLFPPIEVNSNVSEETYGILEHIIELLGFDLGHLGFRNGLTPESLSHLVRTPFG